MKNLNLWLLLVRKSKIFNPIFKLVFNRTIFMKYLTTELGSNAFMSNSIQASQCSNSSSWISTEQIFFRITFLKCNSLSNSFLKKIDFKCQTHLLASSSYKLLFINWIQLVFFYFTELITMIFTDINFWCMFFFIMFKSHYNFQLL